jgi:hypothetical protein
MKPKFKVGDLCSSNLPIAENFLKRRSSLCYGGLGLEPGPTRLFECLMVHCRFPLNARLQFLKPKSRKSWRYTFGCFATESVTRSFWHDDGHGYGMICESGKANYKLLNPQDLVLYIHFEQKTNRFYELLERSGEL